MVWRISVLNTCDYFFCVLQIEDSLYLIVSVTCVSHRMLGNKVAYKQGGESPKHVSRRVASLTGVCIQIAVFPHPCRQGVFHLHTHTPPTPNVLTHAGLCTLSSPSVSGKTSFWEGFVTSSSSCPSLNSSPDFGLAIYATALQGF